MRVHAFLHVDRDGALAEAADSDARRARGEARGPLDGVPDRGEGRPRHPRTADHLRLEDPRGLDPALRRHRRRAAARGRPADPGQDQHGRVRDGLLDRALRLRPHPQPVGPRPHPGRLRRRLRGRGRRLRGPARHRHRHRRLHPPARCRHRHRRREADLRRRLPLRPRGPGQQPRPGRPGHPHRARRGDAARRHRRPRPARLHVDPAGVALLHRGGPGRLRPAT